MITVIGVQRYSLWALVFLGFLNPWFTGCSTGDINVGTSGYPPQSYLEQFEGLVENATLIETILPQELALDARLRNGTQSVTVRFSHPESVILARSTNSWIAFTHKGPSLRYYPIWSGAFEKGDRVFVMSCVFLDPHRVAVSRGGEWEEYKLESLEENSIAIPVFAGGGSQG